MAAPAPPREPDARPRESNDFGVFAVAFNEDILNAVGERDRSPKNVEGRTTSPENPIESCEFPRPVDMAKERVPTVLVPTEDESEEPREDGWRDIEAAEEGDMVSGWSPGGTPTIEPP